MAAGKRKSTPSTKSEGSAQRQQDADMSQSDRFTAKAREIGLDERDETFDAALKKVARHKPNKDPGHKTDQNDLFEKDA